MVMYANEFKTKEKQKLTEIKNLLQHRHPIYAITCRQNFTDINLGELNYFPWQWTNIDEK